MSDTHTLGPWLERFLTEYIVTERNLARNTQKTYRDTFSLLLPFVSRKVRKPVDVNGGVKMYRRGGAKVSHGLGGSLSR